MQTKLLQTSKQELKFSVNTDGITYLKGYASVFGGVDSVGDTIIQGAYSKTLAKLEAGEKRQIHMRWNHYGDVIGKWTMIKEDDIGLYVEGELTPGHSVADNAAASLKHGAISGISIGYQVLDADQEGVIRRLKEIDLIEMSIVEEPADNSARVNNIKSALLDCKSLSEIEGLLKAQGKLSNTEVTAIVSAVKRVVHRDDEIDNDKISAMFNQLKQSIS